MKKQASENSPLSDRIEGKHLFCQYPASDYNIIIKALEMMEAFKSVDNIGKTNINFGMLTKGFQLLERIKLPKIASKAKNILDSVKNSKIIIYLSYKYTINWAYNYFVNNGYNALILTSDLNPNDRNWVLSQFQKPNNDFRILIAIQIMGGVGIELDDKDGNYPRYMLINPTYNFLNMSQCIGRVNRVDTKTNTQVRFIYSYENEKKILERIRSKGEVAKGSVVNEEARKFISQYESIDEKDDFLSVNQDKNSVSQNSIDQLDPYWESLRNECLSIIGEISNDENNVDSPNQSTNTDENHTYLDGNGNIVCCEDEYYNISKICVDAYIRFVDKIQNINRNMCPISLEEIKFLVITPCCKNVFEYAELANWLHSGKKCPLCRSQIQYLISENCCN